MTYQTVDTLLSLISICSLHINKNNRCILQSSLNVTRGQTVLLNQGEESKF